MNDDFNIFSGYGGLPSSIAVALAYRNRRELEIMARVVVSHPHYTQGTGEFLHQPSEQRSGMRFTLADGRSAIAWMNDVEDSADDAQGRAYTAEARMWRAMESLR